MSETKFKIGDIVYGLTKGRGKVLDVYASMHGWRVVVQFDMHQEGDTSSFYGDGRVKEQDLIPFIYHTSPEITIPKRKVKREVKRWIVCHPENIGYTDHESASRSPIEDYVRKVTEVTLIWEEEVEG